MAHIYERVVSLISKEPRYREDRDVELLIPWFQDMSELFMAQTTDSMLFYITFLDLLTCQTHCNGKDIQCPFKNYVLQFHERRASINRQNVVQDIVRNCEFRSVPEDTLIIRQGERGNCFYIILSGLVSIYINQTLEDEGNIQLSSSPGSNSRRQKTSIRSATSRRQQSARHRSPPKSETDDNNNCDDSLVNNTDNSSVEVSADTKEHSDGEESHHVEQPSEETRSRSRLSSRKSSSGTEISNAEIRALLKEHDNSYFTESSDEEEECIIASDDDVFGVDRKLLGNHIRQLDAGQSFGELALVQTNVRRNATVITDGQTDLLVVNRDLYNRSLKFAQQQELKEKIDFVNTLPLFKTLTPNLKNVMAMSLTPLRFQYGNTLVKQGDPVRRILFLLSGHAKISMDPIQHIQQYSWLCTDEELQFAKGIRNGRESRLSWPGKPKQTDVRGLSQMARRRGNYVDAEREHNRKLAQICVIGPTEYIGDAEVFLKLPTYTTTVTCMEPVQAFELNLTNFERIIAKRSHSTWAAMRKMAETKLRSRVSRLADEQVFCAVIQRILAILEEQNTPPPVKAARRKEEEEATSMVLHVPSWHNYRDKQRQFLRKRERERRQRQHQAERMSHAARLAVQMRRQSSNNVETPKMKPSEPEEIKRVDQDVMMIVRRLSKDMVAAMMPINLPRRGLPAVVQPAERSRTLPSNPGPSPMNATRSRSSSESSSSFD